MGAPAGFAVRKVANGDILVPDAGYSHLFPSSAANEWRYRDENNTVYTLAELALAQTFTNKTIDASANSLSNLTTSMFATNVIDTDGTLAANSDTRIATQKAVRTYVATAVTGLLHFEGSTDCSGNPNYPVAVKGDAYLVTVAGKIGGASGVSVDVGDVYFAIADNAGGTQAAVGSSWDVLEHNLVGALLSANNLSDLSNVGTARTNLGATTVGSNLFTLANPSAVTFLRVNADNSVSTRTAAQFKSDLAITTSDVSGLGTMAVQNANGVAITGGVIDGTTIGGTTRAAGNFTSLSASLNTSTLPAALTGTVLRVSQADGAVGRVQVDAFGSVAFFTGVRYGGTAAAPAALSANDQISGFNAWGYDGAAAVGPVATIRTFAAENWTNAAHGAYAEIAVTPAGTTTLTTSMRFEADGGITVPNGVAGGSKGAGTINATTLYEAGASLATKYLALSGGTLTGLLTAPQLSISGNVSAAAWTSAGVGWKTVASTFTDTSSSGTVATVYAHFIASPTIAASSATTYTTAATLAINGPPTAGANVTITNAHAFVVNSGLVRFFSGFTATGTVLINASNNATTNIGTGSTTSAVTIGGGSNQVNVGSTLNLTGNISAAAWTTAGIGLIGAANTYTDTTSSGTVAEVRVHRLQAPTLAASNATTYTVASTLVIDNAPTSGSNVTITNPLALLVLNGNARFNGFIGVGNTPLAALYVNEPISAAAWTSSGITFRIVGTTLTDTTSSGTVSQCYPNVISAPTLAASSSTTYTTAATLMVSGAPTAGSNVTITAGLSFLALAGDARFNGFVGIGGNPAAQLHLSGNLSGASWSTTGLGIRVSGATYTDTAASGTVALAVGHVIGAPTFAASSSVTYTEAATMQVNGPPSAGSNVSITSGLAFRVSGATRLNGLTGIGVVPAAGIHHNQAISAAAWTTNGLGLRVDGNTYTDTTSSGTVANVSAHTIAAQTLAASSSVTFTDASTLRIGAAPIAGSNVTITNGYALYVVGGNARLQNQVGINVAPAAILHVAGNLTAAAWTTNGINVRTSGQTFTDSSSSGTVATVAVSALASPTLAASSSTTYTNAATLYIAGAPGAGSNVTITNGYALLISAGRLGASGGATINGDTISLNVNSNFSVSIGTGTTTGGVNICGSSNTLGFFGVTAVARQNTTGTSTGFTANSGTAVNDASTFTGGTGATAYRISDVVLALKNYGLLAA